MVESFYQIPIKFSKLKQKNQELARCELTLSIRQNIYIIITSKFQEHRFDNTYGCELWEMDFELIANENLWLEKIRKSILQSVFKYERRLNDIDVNLRILQEEQETRYNNVRSIKKKLEIKVDGKLVETGEPLNYNLNIFISPLSLD